MHPVKATLSSIEIKLLIKLQSAVILPSNDIDNLWQASSYFRNSSIYRPYWSGYMQNISKGEYPDQPKLRICQYSTSILLKRNAFIQLLFIQEQAKILNIVTSWLTFEQPLWIEKDSGDYKIKIIECSL